MVQSVAVGLQINEASPKMSLLTTDVDSNTSLKEDVDLLEHQRRIKCVLKYALITIFGLMCVALIVVFIVVPVVFANSIEIQRLLMFTNIGLPKDRKYYSSIPEHPAILFRNFYLTFQDDTNETISLGMWHLLAYDLYPNDTDDASGINYDKLLANDSADVVVYFHGSGETRHDAIMMYDVLLRFFHVIAFDYRDYGDSTPAKLSEQGVASDAIHVFEWIRKRTMRKIYIWGHSLGTPLGTLTVTKLPHYLKPHGLVLESPFTNMSEEIPLHPYGRLFAWLPWFKQTIQGPLERNRFIFNTSGYILDVDCPIMILHAEDDSIIPYTLGKKLANIAATQRSDEQGNVTYVQFLASLHYDHFRIYRSPKLLSLIPNFTVICDEFFNKTNSNRTLTNFD